MEFLIRRGILSQYDGPGGEAAIPEGVTKIGRRAFFGSGPLVRVTIPEGVTEIRESAFLQQKTLEAVRIPEGVQQIGRTAFYGCSSLKEVRLPESLVKLGGNAFGRCERLEEVFIPQAVERVGEQAFWGCTSLRRVTIAEGAGRIGAGAFECCSSLAELNLQGRFQKIPAGAFPDSVQVIRAPRTPISAFAESCRTSAAIGFAELRREGAELEEEIQEDYLRHIRAHRQALYPEAFRHLPLLELLYKERLLSPADFQALRQEAERQGNIDALAVLEAGRP